MARDEDYARLQKEMQSFAKNLEYGTSDQEEKARELQANIKKFTRKYQAIREIDFFPTSQGERTAMLLNSLEERRQILSGATVKPTPTPIAKKDSGEHLGNPEAAAVHRPAGLLLADPALHRSGRQADLHLSQKNAPRSRTGLLRYGRR